MSWDPPSASPSPTPDPGDPALAALVRLRGGPLLDALEARLPGSREHAEATGSYAFAAAVAMDLGTATAELARETAKLHDVGMVYVSQATARKPAGEWDDSEREEFEAHYEAGARLALGAGIPGEVCGWLMQIRERWDGAGPEGLAGEAIPVASRLTRAACAADTVLAFAKESESLADRRARAASLLRGAAGAELDPRIAEILAASLSQQAYRRSPEIDRRYGDA